MINALLLSASREGNTGYLEHALPMINDFLNEQSLDSSSLVVFVPYAGVSISYDDYFNMVSKALSSLDINFKSIHQFDDPKQAIESADALLIGGGNTFELLNRLYQYDLIELIQERVKTSMAYIGWSAGSNVAGQSIKTTNDMPIVEPHSFNAIQLVPFQLNPHYTEYKPPGHNGETREMRIQEFMILNPDQTVVGIQEGSALKIKGKKISLLGSKPAFIFHQGKKEEVSNTYNFSALMEQ